MKPLPLLSAVLALGLMSPVRAGLFWADHSDEILFDSSRLDWTDKSETVFTLTGHAGSLGKMDSTFSSPGGFWVDYGYKGKGSLNWARPGYLTSLSSSTSPIYRNWSEVIRISNENGFGIPPLLPGSALSAAGWYDSTVTITSRFEHLTGGVLPAGSWICCASEGDNILTISAFDGWMARRFTAAVPHPYAPPDTPLITLLSADGAKVAHRYSGAVFIQTAVPLTQISASVVDPTPSKSYDGSGSGAGIDFAVAVATPDGWVPPVRTAPFQVTDIKYIPGHVRRTGYYPGSVEIFWPAEMETPYSVQASTDLESWITLTSKFAQKRNETAAADLPPSLDGRPKLYFRVIRD